MVAVFSKSWLPTSLRLIGIGGGGKSTPEDGGRKKKLEILSFEAARTMSRLASLHRSLSDDEVTKLRAGVMRCYAVSHLNSTDQHFLLRLVCAEMVDDLDKAAAAVSRLASRCSNSAGPWPKGFPHVYADLKAGKGSGGIDWRVLGFPTKDVEKRMRKMEGYAEGMAAVHEEMEVLAEMEASEKRLQRWKSYSGPIPQQQQPLPEVASPSYSPPGAEMFKKKLAWQRKVVRKMKEEALWGQNIDKVTELLARAVVTVFARICFVFGDAVPELPRVHTDRNGRFRLTGVHGGGVNRYNNNNNHSHQTQFRVFPDHFSGPLDRQGPAYQLPKGDAMIRNSGPLMFPTPVLFQTQEPFADEKSPHAATDPDKKTNQPWTARVLVQPATTLGGAGLALRYADVVALAERMLYSPELVGEEAKSQLYQMLPGELRKAVAATIRRLLRKESVAAMQGVMEERVEAGKWREEARKVLGWLAPMANDTIRWFTERSYEKQKLEAGPKVLVLQTLCWSDRKKAEAAMVDVLVALSFVFRYLQGSASNVASDQDEQYWD